MITNQTSKEICSYFLEGHTYTECSLHFNICQQSVLNHLHKNNIKLSYKTSDFSLDKTYFTKIDSEYKAYFLGFLVADGSISKETNRVSFMINSEDSYILQKLKEDIKSSNMVRNYKIFDKRTQKTNNSSVFQFSSKQIKNDLFNLGVSSFKTQTFNFPNIDKEYFSHFLRGLMDGDGYISDHSVVSLISTKEFLQIINKYLFKNTGKISIVAEYLNVYRLIIRKSRTTMDFLDYLYKDASIYLDRKYKKYLESKKNILNKKQSRKVKTIYLLKDNIVFKEFSTLTECSKFLGRKPCTLSNSVRNKSLIKGYSLKLGDSHMLTTPFNLQTNFENNIDEFFRQVKLM